MKNQKDVYAKYSVTSNLKTPIVPGKDENIYFWTV